MNCPSRTDGAEDDGHNQNPYILSADLTTRSDLGRIANARLQREHRLSDPRLSSNNEVLLQPPSKASNNEQIAHAMDATMGTTTGADMQEREKKEACQTTVGVQPAVARMRSVGDNCRRPLLKVLGVLRKYLKFVGPGFMISVAYIDPGNYATDVAAGASYRFKLLFMILLSNVFAVFLQSLCINLGTVTGLNLAEMTKAHCPPWLNYISFVFGECAIIATDMAEIIGTAIAIYMLSDGRIPLYAGCAISIADVFIILFFYRQNRASITARRAFECFVALLVLGVVVCFGIQLSYIKHVTVGEVFRGYVPSSALVQPTALYQACGILGATVMPHSLYLGSGLVQDRLRDFDKDHNLLSQAELEARDDDSLKDDPYRPSMQAIKSCRGYSIAECAISLFTFALFVNSAILIVAGASLYGVPGAPNASLFGIYELLSHSLAPAVGKLFAVALLLSGISAGIVCTIAGQMISEGQLRLKMRPWLRRLTIRSIAVMPAIVVAGLLGKDGIDKALVGSQVALSVILPFVISPLIWFTCFGKYMKVTPDRIRNLSVQRGAGRLSHDEGDNENANGNETSERDGSEGTINMRAHPVTAFFAVLIWAAIVLMNVALIVLLGLGKA